MPGISDAAKAAKNVLKNSKALSAVKDAIMENKVPLAAGGVVTGLATGAAYNGRMESRKHEEEMLESILRNMRDGEVKEAMLKESACGKLISNAIKSAAPVLGSAAPALAATGAVGALAGAKAFKGRSDARDREEAVINKIIQRNINKQDSMNNSMEKMAFGTTGAQTGVPKTTGGIGSSLLGGISSIGSAIGNGVKNMFNTVKTNMPTIGGANKMSVPGAGTTKTIPSYLSQMGNANTKPIPWTIKGSDAPGLMNTVKNTLSKSFGNPSSLKNGAVTTLNGGNKAIMNTPSAMGNRAGIGALKGAGFGASIGNANNKLDAIRKGPAPRASAPKPATSVPAPANAPKAFGTDANGINTITGKKPNGRVPIPGSTPSGYNRNVALGGAANAKAPATAPAAAAKAPASAARTKAPASKAAPAAAASTTNAFGTDANGINPITGKRPTGRVVDPNKPLAGYNKDVAFGNAPAQAAPKKRAAAPTRTRAANSGMSEMKSIAPNNYGRAASISNAPSAGGAKAYMVNTPSAGTAKMRGPSPAPKLSRT